MSQQLRQLKSRIRSVEGTWKVTRAMEMVAMAKYKSVDSLLLSARPYFRKLSSIAARLVASDEAGSTHPFLARGVNKGKAPIGILIIASEAGLCGIYNTHLFRMVDTFIAEHQDRDIRLYLFGRKAVNYYRKRGYTVARVFPPMHGKIKPGFYQEAYTALTGDFLKKEISEVHVASTVFINAMKHSPRVEKLLPFEAAPTDGGGALVESGARGILADVLPMYLSNCLRLMFLESLTSEYSARMVAMKAAKDNARELMSDLILLRNKIRQASITKEVIEIISSVEALKG